jgi:hypothetical protein
MRGKKKIEIRSGAATQRLNPQRARGLPSGGLQLARGLAGLPVTPALGLPALRCWSAPFWGFPQRADGNEGSLSHVMPGRYW